jgi:hypothetical protein
VSPTGPLRDDKWREWPLDELGEPSNTARLDATQRRHGLLPKLSGDATEALLGDGTFGSPTAADHTHELADITDAGTAAAADSGDFAAASHAHDASNITTGTMATARLGSGTANSATFLRGDQTWDAPTATVAISTASIAFTDGDTARRSTISDAAVSATSKIICTVVRPTTADDSADSGYVYDANVVRRATGSFDVLVRCTDIGGMDCTEKPPNETLTLCYQVA